MIGGKYLLKMRAIRAFASIPAMNYSYLVLLALAVVLLRVFQTLRRARLQRLPFPPGPPCLPLVGNFRDLSTEFPWLTYTAWKRQYGAYT